MAPATVSAATVSASTGEGLRASKALVGALALGVFVLSLLQTLVVPVLAQIASALHSSPTAAGWVSTSTLLTASVLTPLAGRLGDVHGKRPVLLVALGITLAGSLLAALTSSMMLLLAGRVLQGASFGVFPLALGILREEYPPKKLTSAMAIVSSTLGFGGGVALVATGLLTKGGGDYHRIFWLATGMTLLSLVVAAVVIPKRRGPGGSVDWLGAVVLGAGLVLLLLPLSQGHLWGWLSVATIGCFVGSGLVLTCFVQLQRRTAVPLVSPALLANRAVAVTNLAALGVGFGMFAVFLGLSYFVQVPTQAAGYGFTASVLAASAVYLLPGTAAMVLVSPLGARLVGSVGPRLVLIGSAVAGALGFAVLGAAHTQSWELIVGGVIVMGALGGAYAAMPALIVTNVEPSVTGVANGVNSIARSVGSSIGSALVVTILASAVGPRGWPAESAFLLIFILGGVALAAVAVAVCFALPAPQRSLTEQQKKELVALADAGMYETAGVTG